MLRKLIKYDKKALRKISLSMFLVALVAGALSGVCNRFMDKVSEYVALEMLFSLINILSLFALAASMLVVIVFVALRFYRNFYTDEGYLTFTLPARRTQLMFSKTLVGFCAIVKQLIAILGGVAIILAFVWDKATDETAVTSVAEIIVVAIRKLWKSDPKMFVIYAVEGFLGIIAYLFFDLMLIYLCISLASVIVKKARIAVAIAIFYFANSFVIGGIELAVILLTLSASEGFYLLVENVPLTEQNALMVLFILALIIFLLIEAFICYMINLAITERRLNLE
ncbi:MAG: hypothetical protein IKV20_01320 [Clostridia bacterium]|nr:hypothetical protein [Clostridia bacterium]